jgi:ketosteroid isomerase-like protein
MRDERSGDDEQVAAAQRAVWEAANARDLEALERLIDDAFVLVEADSLERRGKKEFLDQVASRGDQDAPLRFELARVQVQATAEMAVAYGQFEAEDDVEGERITVRGNTVDVFRRRDGRWLLVGSVYGEVSLFEA